ncbi:MAG: class I SAM-dependent RNA methyltransferase [Bacilli bacterium]|nr:class I SAM-dependent RNA methyltransferase [Bacilli bacterium]
MLVEIVRMDDFGRGIGYLNDKVIFIPKTIVGDKVNVLVVKEYKNYLIGRVIKIIELSVNRINSKCPFFDKCGGCDLLEINYENTLNYKVDKIANLLKRNDLDLDISIVSNPNPFNYRNKVSLKIVDGLIGYYESNTNTLVNIDNCLVAKEEINKFIKEYKYLNLNNALITIRCNYNNELLIVIESKESCNIDVDYLANKFNIKGIIYNNKCIYKDNYFYEKINNYRFKVSYNSFFQVNPYITSKLFNYLEENINEGIILDLYSGVGTLSIVASKNANKVYSLEIVENAIKDGILNSKLNHVNNIEFIGGNVNKTINMINDNIDTIIVDPPRSGLDNKTFDSIIKIRPNKIIYISCNPNTLMRDLSKFKEDYNFDKIKLFDMFSYSEHVETVCLLKLKKL